MHRDSRSAAIGVAKLLMRAALSYFDEAQSFQFPNYFPRLENGQGAHGRLRDLYQLGAEELSFEPRVTVLQEHFDDLMQVLAKLVFRSSLAVSTWKPRYAANAEPGV